MLQKAVGWITSRSIAGRTAICLSLRPASSPATAVAPAGMSPVAPEVVPAWREIAPTRPEVAPAKPRSVEPPVSPGEVEVGIGSGWRLDGESGLLDRLQACRNARAFGICRTRCGVYRNG